MNIKDTKGITHIRFENFRKLPATDPIFVEMKVSVDINNFTANTKVTIELTDLKEMLSNLEVLNKTLERTFYFQHIDEQVKIKFEPLKTGTILIEGSLRSNDYSTSLEFKFETDQTLLLELMEDCRIEIKELEKS